MVLLLLLSVVAVAAAVIFLFTSFFFVLDFFCFFLVLYFISFRTLLGSASDVPAKVVEVFTDELPHVASRVALSLAESPPTNHIVT